MPFNLEELQQNNAPLLTLLTEHLPDMLWVKDVENRYIYVNEAMCNGLLMAENVQEPIGKKDLFFALRERELHKDDPKWHTFGELCLNTDVEVVENNKAMKFVEYGNVKGKAIYLEVYKAPFYDKDGNIIGTVGAGRDITQMTNTQLELKNSLEILNTQQALLDYKESYDSLTDLPNRTLCIDRLEQSIEVAKECDNEIATLFIDLDHFKEINDSAGHDMGDKVLVEFANRLKTIMHHHDTLSRFSGDEFCVILNNIENIDSVSSFILESHELLKEPFEINGKTFYISMSIGVSLYPHDGLTPNVLLKNADAAMYKAKENGRASYSFYNEEMTTKAVNRVYLETQLRKALTKDELVVYFQPQINAKDGFLVGMEALVRWEHPEMGLVSPDSFIPIAELTGMIVELDRIVMKKAIAQFNTWKEMGFNPGKLAMNLAMQQLESDDFLEYIKEILSVDKCKHRNIELEVTESKIMNKPEQSIKVLQELHNMGITIAIDDFGTGYSSLAYLKRLPISKLKIDKSFVDNLPNDTEDVAISKTIINLCKSLNLKVIAEGVETQEQNDFLVENGCSFIQGYFYSKPLCVEDMTKYLEKQKKD